MDAAPAPRLGPRQGGRIPPVRWPLDDAEEMAPVWRAGGRQRLQVEAGRASSQEKRESCILVTVAIVVGILAASIAAGVVFGGKRTDSAAYTDTPAGRLARVVEGMRGDVKELCAGAWTDPDASWIPGILVDWVHVLVQDALHASSDNASEVMSVMTNEGMRRYKCGDAPNCWWKGLRTFGTNGFAAADSATDEILALLQELPHNVPVCVESAMSLLLKSALVASSFANTPAPSAADSRDAVVAFAFGAGEEGCVLPLPPNGTVRGASWLRRVALADWPVGADGSAKCMSHTPGATNVALAAAALSAILDGAESSVLQWEVGLCLAGYTVGGRLVPPVEVNGKTLYDVGGFRAVRLVFPGTGYLSTYGVAAVAAHIFTGTKNRAAVIYAHPDHAPRCFWDLTGAAPGLPVRFPAAAWGRWAQWEAHGADAAGYWRESTQAATRSRAAFLRHELWLRPREFGPLPDAFSSPDTRTPSPRFGVRFTSVYTSMCATASLRRPPFFALAS
eukprot:Hpha_TRINITY_DN35754_c0_g1::TRINITY_DN35754_c0_g1_i1::g.139894::m.139894